MLQNPNFPGLHFGPRWGAYSAPPGSLTDGEGLAAPVKNSTPALGPLSLVSAGFRV